MRRRKTSKARSCTVLAPRRVMRTAEDSRIGSPKISRPAWRSVLPVSTTSAMASATPSWMLVSTAPSRRTTLGADAVLLEVGAHHAGVGRGDPLAGEVGDVGELPARAREAEPAAPEAEVDGLLGLGAGVEQQVAPGDADVEGALPDVQGDVAGAQVEELDVVLGVDERELLGVVALAVAGLAQDLRGRLRQAALVGDGDAQRRARGPGRGCAHCCLTGGRRRRRARGRRPAS